jgi:hypothetical protein
MHTPQEIPTFGIASCSAWTIFVAALWCIIHNADGLIHRPTFLFIDQYVEQPAADHLNLQSQ